MSVPSGRRPWFVFAVALLATFAWLPPAAAQRRVPATPASPATAQPPASPAEAASGTPSRPEPNSGPGEGWEPVSEPQVVSYGGQSRVRVGGSIVIERGERADDVVAVFGSVTVRGDVSGQVVAVLGNVEIADGASVAGDIVAVGGRLSVAPTAKVSAHSQRVAVGFPEFSVASPGEPDFTMRLLPDRAWVAGALLAISSIRLAALVVLSLAILLLFPVPVRRVADQLAATPLASTIVGLGAQVMALPVALGLVLALVASIIGIPLLLLVPVAAILVGALWTVGFVGASVGVGRGVLRLFGAAHPPLAVSFVLGAAPFIALTWLSRYSWWLGHGGAFVTTAAVTGVLLEGLLWTLGAGAGLMLWLNRFGGRTVIPATPPPVAPAPPVPVDL